MLEYAEIARTVERHVRARKTGTLFITTSDQHSARLALRDGEIVAIAYRVTRGLAAIPMLASIRGGTVTFQEGFVLAAATSEALPPTDDLLIQLGVT